MPKPDTFAEVVRDIEAVASQFTHEGAPTAVSEMMTKAARLLAAAGEVCKAAQWSKHIRGVGDDCCPLCDNPQDVGHAAGCLYTALNALAPELKETDHAG